MAKPVDDLTAPPVKPASRRTAARGRGVARGLTRGNILEAAKAIIADQGTAGFQIRDLAKALGVQPPAIYNHFAGRDEVLGALSSMIGDQLFAAGETEPSASPTERLTSLVRSFTALMYRDPLVARIQLEDIATSHLVDRGTGRAVLAAGRARIERLIADGVSAGEFRPINVSVLRAILLAGIPAAVCWDAYEGGERPSCEALQAALVDSILRQVRP